MPKLRLLVEHSDTNLKTAQKPKKPAKNKYED